MIAPIVIELIDATFESVEQLKDSIINVKSAGFTEDFKYEKISFEIVGNTHKNGKFVGILKGRNQDSCVGFGKEQDKAIATRVLIDGDISKID